MPIEQAITQIPAESPSAGWRYCAAVDLLDRAPTAGVAWPAVDLDYAGSSRPGPRAGPRLGRGRRQALRSAAVVRLLGVDVQHCREDDGGSCYPTSLLGRSVCPDAVKGHVERDLHGRGVVRDLGE